MGQEPHSTMGFYAYTIVKLKKHEDKQNRAPLSMPCCDTNMALFPSFTLSLHICAEIH